VILLEKGSVAHHVNPSSSVFWGFLVGGFFFLLLVNFDMRNLKSCFKSP